MSPAPGDPGPRDAAILPPELPSPGPLGPLAGGEVPGRLGLDDRPFALRGRLAYANGAGGSGVAEVRCLGRRVVSRLELPDAEVVDAWLTPLGRVRRLRIGGLAVEERLLVSREGPLAFLEWVPETEAAAIELAWITDLDGGDAGPFQWARSEGGLAVAAGGAGRALFAFSHPVETLEVDPAERGVRVRARLVASPGAGIRMAMAGSPDASARVPRLMGRPAVAVRSREAAARRAVTGRLAVDTPEPAVNQAVAWAKLELDGRSLEGAGAGETAAVTRRALAVLGAGDFDFPRAVLNELAAGPGRRRAHAAGFLLLAARTFAWTGDRATLGRLWPAVMEAASTAEPGRALAAALTELEPVARALGVDVPSAVGDPVDPVPAVPPGSPGWRTAAGDALWRKAVDAPLGWAGWEEEVVDGLVHGVLGAEPDAARGRLELHPRLPHGWDRAAVAALRMGDAEVALDYSGEGNGHRFELRQTRGAAPLQIVLAPELPGAFVAGAAVDGEPAELDPVRARGRWRVPVQLVLDGDRSLHVEMAAENV